MTAPSYMETFVSQVVANTGWLYTRLYQNHLFFFDLWSLVHFWCGFVLMSGLRRPFPGRKWLLLAVLLVAWELLELYFIYSAFHIFLAETLKDQLTDVLVGLLGGAACELAVLWSRKPGTRLHVLAGALVALTLAFLWVGHYGYRYNHEFFNTPGLNWWAFLLWSLASVALSWHYSRMVARWQSHLRAVMQTLLTYCLVLLGVEYAGYVMLGIREISHKGQPLVFDLIHGTPSLWAAYVLAPILNTYAYLAARHHLRWSAGLLPDQP